MRDLAGPLPNKFNYLLPEVALVEACSATRGSPVALAHKLLRFLKQNRSRMFYASHLRHLMDAETSPGVLANRYLIAYRPFFNSEEDAINVDVANLEEMVQDVVECTRSYVSIMSEFEDGRSRFAAACHDKATRYGNLQNSTPADIEHAIVQPSFVARWATLFDDRFATPEWQVALDVFPDRHAVGRWWRATLWYWLREARGIGPKRLRNDWWDSVYVFTASYADQFWTADEEAAHLVSLLFNQTKVVFRTPQEIGQSH